MDYASNSKSAPQDSKISRINADVERTLSLVRSVIDARDRVQRNATALGYFSDPAGAGEAGGKVQPISSNMQNAIDDLERAVKGLHGVLNLFD